MYAAWPRSKARPNFVKAKNEILSFLRSKKDKISFFMGKMDFEKKYFLKNIFRDELSLGQIVVETNCRWDELSLRRIVVIPK